MSFSYVPGEFRIPKIPNFDLPDGVWVGSGTDAGYLAFKLPYSYWGDNIMVRNDLCFSLKVNGSTLSPVYTPVNGYMHWSGGGHLYYTQTYGWVYMTGMFPGYEPLEENVKYDRDKGVYTGEGDAFYTCWGLPSYEGDEVELRGRGSLYGKEPKTLTASWNRWICETGEFGRYEPQGSATGTRYLGLPRFRGSNNEYFVRSLEKTNGRFTYGRIRYQGGKWVIGSIGADSGWHEGDEPDRDGGSVSFRFCKNEGSEAKGSDITVTLQDFVKGDETGKAYFGEVAIWR